MRTGIFLGYMVLLSRVRDLRRVFEYHGAEHKTISCFEAGLPLTPANAQRFSRLHPRCGTSFLLIVMIVAIFVFAPIGLPAWYWLVATRILGVPLIAGISFELIKFAGRNRRRRWVRAVMWPGLKLQLLTTREPDLDQLEVAIAALRRGARAREARGALGGRPGGRRGRRLARRRGAAEAVARSGPLDWVCMIEELVRQIEARFAELGEQMTDPEVISDRERYAEAGRAYSQLEPAAKLAEEWRRARRRGGRRGTARRGGRGHRAARGAERRARADRAARGGDPPGDGRARPQRREERDRRDPGRRGRRRGRAVGRRPLPDAEQVRRAARLADRADGHRRRQVHVRGQGRRRVFGLQVRGRHPPRAAVPQTESQGRIHTSTATVAVLPEAEDVDVQIDPNDLQIDVYRSSGPGGQSVNTTDSAVRITHKPSGIVVSMQDEKSQLQNREKALRVLRARLYERALAEQQAELAADRRSQVGTGDRAEKIRTYNYGERRVTDHRIKLTVHNLDQVLEGELDEFTAALQADEKRRRLEAQAAA